MTVGYCARLETFHAEIVSVRLPPRGYVPKMETTTSNRQRVDSLIGIMEPIYRTNGEWVAIYDEGHVFSVSGEWLGFVAGRDVFDPSGEYLGFLSDDRRLLRKRNPRISKSKKARPTRPERPRIPSRMPLAPLMRELPYHIIDVFEEYSERLVFISETRPDME